MNRHEGDEPIHEDLVYGAPLAPLSQSEPESLGPPPADLASMATPLARPLATETRPPHEDQPEALAAVRTVRLTPTRRTRNDLAHAMVMMCTPGGWRATTLNPDLPDDERFLLLSVRYDKLAATDDPHTLYAELFALSAVALGWAQGIARRQWRDAKRSQRARARGWRPPRRRRASG